MVDTGYSDAVDPFERPEMNDEEKVEQGLQCMACRFDINDGEDMGFPRVCNNCIEDEDGDYASPDIFDGERE